MRDGPEPSTRELHAGFTLEVTHVPQFWQLVDNWSFEDAHLHIMRLAKTICLTPLFEARSLCDWFNTRGCNDVCVCVV